MLPILGKPVLWHIYNRLQQSKLLSDVVISTGEYINNKEICEFAKENNIEYFCGMENDIIDRLYRTACKYDADAIVRITGDCPLVDPKIIDEILSVYLHKPNYYDIIRTNKIPTYPHGLEVEITSIETLKKMWLEIKDPKLREWFTVYIDQNSEKFKILDLTYEKNLSKYRLTLDYEEDYELICKIYEKLFYENQYFGIKEILRLFEKYPELKNINSKYVGHRNIDMPK